MSVFKIGVGAEATVKILLPRVGFVVRVEIRFLVEFLVANFTLKLWWLVIKLVSFETVLGTENLVTYFALDRLLLVTAFVPFQMPFVGEFGAAKYLNKLQNIKLLKLFLTCTTRIQTSTCPPSEFSDDALNRKHF